MVMFDVVGTRPLCVADSLVRLMFPAPPRPPARYKTLNINTGEVWIDKANVTHDDNLPLARFLRFGFGWLGRERELEIGHIADKFICVVGETENETGDGAEVGVRDRGSKENESARTPRQREDREDEIRPGVLIEKLKALKDFGRLCKSYQNLIYVKVIPEQSEVHKREGQKGRRAYGATYPRWLGRLEASWRG